MQSKDIPTYPSIVSVRNVIGIFSLLSCLAAELWLCASERPNLAIRLYLEAMICILLGSDSLHKKLLP